MIKIGDLNDANRSKMNFFSIMKQKSIARYQDAKTLESAIMQREWFKE
jgi:hypothetical protein